MKNKIIYTLEKCVEELDLYIGDSTDYEYMEDAIQAILDAVKLLKKEE